MDIKVRIIGALVGFVLLAALMGSLYKYIETNRASDPEIKLKPSQWVSPEDRSIVWEQQTNRE